ncbi:hypothetical protein RZS08_18935, partial [Arthrospira platensis SPKY1]|nr:hypothetical protein [Arthrospira platensis SPKY1]
VPPCCTGFGKRQCRVPGHQTQRPPFLSQTRRRQPVAEDRQRGRDFLLQFPNRATATQFSGAPQRSGGMQVANGDAPAQRFVHILNREMAVTAGQHQHLAGQGDVPGSRLDPPRQEGVEQFGARGGQIQAALMPVPHFFP